MDTLQDSATTGWYPDPTDPGGAIRWWSGHNWSSVTRPAARRVTRLAGHTALRRALAPVRSHWRAFSGIGAAAAAICLGSFVVATYGSGLVFGYDFFTEPSPTTLSEIVATVSLWVVVGVVAAIGTVVFGAYASLSMTPGSARSAIATSMRSLSGCWWWAIPACALVVTASICVVAGPVAVGWFAFVATARVQRSGGGVGHASISWPQRIAIGLPATALTLCIWGLGWIAARFPSPPPWGSAVIVVVGLIATLAVMAWIAAAASLVWAAAAEPAGWRPPVLADELRRQPPPTGAPVLPAVTGRRYWMPPWQPPAQTVSGWKRDPSGQASWRRWNGRSWTERTRSTPRRILQPVGVVLGALVLAAAWIAGLMPYAGHDRPELIDSPAVLGVLDPACVEMQRALDRAGAPPGAQPTVSTLAAENAILQTFTDRVRSLGPDALEADEPTPAWLADWDTLATARDDYLARINLAQIDAPTVEPPQMPRADGSLVASRIASVGLPSCAVPLRILDDFQTKGTTEFDESCDGDVLCLQDGEAVAGSVVPGSEVLIVVQESGSNGFEQSVMTAIADANGTAVVELPPPRPGVSVAVMIEYLDEWSTSVTTAVATIPPK